MSKNKVQFEAGYSLINLFQNYGTEKQSTQTLYKWRWPTVFKCPECGCDKYCFLKARRLYQCHQSHYQTALISETIFEQTKPPLTIWFLAIYLVTQSKKGLSALAALKREIGVSYNTAWNMKHKIMQIMKERDDSKPLSGVIHLDDVYWGGERHGGKRGRDSKNKVPFVTAVSLNKEGHPIAIRVLTMTLLLSGSTVMAADHAELVRQSRAQVKGYAGQLKTELSRTLKSEGIVAAIKHCNTIVPQIDAGSSDKGLIKRTSWFVRNQQNAPNAWEKTVLADFEQRRQQGQPMTTMEHAEVDQQGEQKVFRYMKAIPVQPVCLNCHGAFLQDDLALKLKQLYPMDQATGFQLNDLRGAFSITRQLD